MILDLLATAVPSITIELSTGVTVVLSIIAALLAVIAFFLARELKANDQAHKDLRGDIKTVDTNLRGDIKTVDTNLRGDIKALDSDVKKLLSGDVAWIKVLLERFQK